MCNRVSFVAEDTEQKLGGSAEAPAPQRLFVMALLIAVSGSCAWGQTASVEGLVTNSMTGSPLARVHVTLKDPANNASVQYGAQTAGTGKFSITGVAPGSYLVLGERVGFAPGRSNVTLRADDKKTDLQVKLTPVGAITGRITDADGQPVERASVITEGATRKEVSTDEMGRFRIGGLTPGKYRVKASHESWMYAGLLRRPEIRTDGTVEVHNATTYYPGVLTAKQAGKVEVAPDGESTGIDIQLVGVPFVRISGEVVGMPHGAPNAFVSIGNGAYPPKADGSFEFWGMDPGHYRLSGSWGNPGGTESVQTLFGPRISTAPVEVAVVGSNIDNIELRVVPDSDIKGRLETATPDGTAPVQQRTVTLREMRTGSTIGSPAAVGADDAFQLDKVTAGKYLVGLSWDTAYVKSMRLGTTVINGDALDLSDGAGGAGLTLVLGTAMGSVSGTVRDGQGKAAEARVILARSREDTIFVFQSAKARQDGAYSFPNVPPGDYKLLAVPEDDADFVTQRSGLADYEDLMDRVEIHAGDKAPVDLALRTADGR